MLTYKTAPTVAAGSPPTSAQWNQFAQAVNDRLGGGAGDPTWRMWYKAYSIARNVRGPTGGAYPAADEWLSHYMHVAPPAAPDWEPELDLNPLLAFVRGSDSYGQDPESRINVIPSAAALPLDATTAWALGKAQRGAVVPGSGLEAAPALYAARTHWPMVFANQQALWGTSDWSPYLRKYGGVFPVITAEETGCNGAPVYDPDAEEMVAGPGQSRYIIKFKNIAGGADQHWDYTCPYLGMTPLGGDSVKSVGLTEDAYVVVTWDDVAHVLPFSQFVLGPYTAAAELRHSDALAVSEFLQRFSSEFRGTEAAREGDGYRVRAVAFDFQRFFTSQYLLAPAFGTGDEEGVTPVYPLFEKTAAMEQVNAGEFFLSEGGGDPQEFAESGMNGFVAAGVYVTSEGLTEPVRLQLYDWDAEEPVVAEFTVPVSTEGPKVIWFSTPRSAGSLRVKALDTIFDPQVITVEVALLEAMKPRMQDAYVVLRRGTTTGTALGLDAIGQTTSAKQLSDDYFAWGAIATDEDVGTVLPEDSGVYDAARRMIRERMRLMKRTSLKGYAVEGGKSVLWFDRFVTIGGDDFDAWDGVASALDPIESGKIESGVLYRVEGTITYNEVELTDENFTGVDGVESFTGDGTVYEREGIRTQAPRHGLSNEWQMFLTSNCYNDSEGSSWKPENYGDIIAFLHQRCHTLSGGMFYVPEICAHAVRPEAVPCALPPLVQAPSAQNYFEQLNANVGADEDDQINFFKSCQVYPADYLVESVTYDAGTQEVRVQFSGRFRTTLAAGDIARVDGPNSCSTEDYRTDENVVRQYLYYAAGSGQCAPLIGDAAELTNPLGEGAWGSCHPRFYFTKRTPKVYVDQPADNDTMQPSDTRLLALETQWVAWVIDAICEGFVDQAGTLDFEECPNGRPVQYRMEHLCLQAAGMLSMGIMPAGVVGNAKQFYASPAGQRGTLVGTDTNKAAGHGPVPNTRYSAEVFNRLSAALNLLVQVPIELPFQLERQKKWFDSTKTFDGSVAAGTPPDPCGSGDDHMYSGQVSGSHGPIDQGDLAESSTDAWEDASGASASCSPNIDYDSTTGSSDDYGFTVSCEGGALKFTLRIQAHAHKVRFKSPQNYVHAVPAHLSDNFDAELRLMAAAHYNENGWANTYPVGTEPVWGPGSPPAFHWNAAADEDVAVSQTGVVDYYRCMQLTINEGAEFNMMELLSEPGYVAPNSFYWAALETVGPVGGTDRYNTRGGPFRQVAVVFSPNVVGTLTMPLV
jgi:hypothetical protein